MQLLLDDPGQRADEVLCPFEPEPDIFVLELHQVVVITALSSHEQAAIHSAELSRHPPGFDLMSVKQGADAAVLG